METLSNLSDFELVQKFINGDKASIEVLINRHRKKVYTYILLVVKDQHLAEDIFQDTFIKVINTLRSGYPIRQSRLIFVILLSVDLLPKFAKYCARGSRLFREVRLTNAST